ncbi:sensor histidine kinase [Halomarina litorea]|uniref:sensor histidine kinase n=1 Tax=Halomarina litorea TaxID=2961595 RepID=UPI0020C2528E|nr:PAS domain-containing sensor histidine kinase [Halomarina sp. BCD28]
MRDSTPQISSSQSAIAALVQNFPNGVLVLFDEDHRYRAVGPNVLPFSKTKATELLGRSIHELFPEQTTRRLEPEMRATIQGHARSFDIEYDDRIHHIETKPTKINGEPYGVLATQDVTQERETADALQEQNERLDQFASMISHDLRNPLSIATGHLELYQETGDSAHLTEVEKALTRLDELTQDLLTLVQPNEMADSLEDVSLSAVAHDAWEMIETRDASLTASDYYVKADRGQLQALFENLFQNAIGHGGDEVTIRVGAREDGFYIEDTGTGIPEEKRETVFEHGFSTGYGGNGVGLTIVSRIANHHGWSIELTEEESGGARFEFTGVEVAD